MIIITFILRLNDLLWSSRRRSSFLLGSHYTPASPGTSVRTFEDSSLSFPDMSSKIWWRCLWYHMLLFNYHRTLSCWGGFSVLHNVLHGGVAHHMHPLVINGILSQDAGDDNIPLGDPDRHCASGITTAIHLSSTCFASCRTCRSTLASQFKCLMSLGAKFYSTFSFNFWAVMGLWLNSYDKLIKIIIGLSWYIIKQIQRRVESRINQERKTQFTWLPNCC